MNRTRPIARPRAGAAFLLAGLLAAALVAPAGCTLLKRDARGEAAPDEGEADGGIAAPTRTHLAPFELETWNDPAFQKEFTESFTAESDIEPRVTLDEREKMQKVLALMSDDKLDAAARLLETYTQDETASAVFDFTLGNLYFRQEKLDEAAAAYLKATKRHKTFQRAWKGLALAHVRRNDFESALPALVRTVELGGGDRIIYGLLGFAHSAVGDPISAESALRMAILLDPETLDWKLGLVQSFLQQQRFADVVAHTERLIAAFPERADLWLIQANAYVGMKEPLRAAENYEMVDRLGQSTVKSLTTLGSIYVNEGLYDLAVDAYGRAMAKALEATDAPAEPGKTPPVAARAVQAAQVLSARGADDATETLLDKVEALYGGALTVADQKDVLKLRARLAMAREAEDEEARVLERVVELDPLDGEALILLGRHAARKGDVEKAVFYFERAAAIEEYEPDALVSHAKVLAREGKYTEALPLLRRAQQLKPRNAVQDFLEDIERVAKSRS